MRPWKIWLGFALGLAVVLAALSWITLGALALDRAEHEAQTTAVLEENLRLALWRLDSAVAPILGQASSYPYFAYTSFYPAERAYTRMFAEIERGEILVPSPLLEPPSPYILLNFQVGPEGFVSPQAPTGNMRDLAETGYLGCEQVEAAGDRLAQLSGLLDLESLRQEMIVERASALDGNLGADNQLQLATISTQRQGFDNREAQALLNTNEYTARNWAVAANPVQQEWAGNKGGGWFEKVDEGPFRALWVEGQLLFVRHLNVQGQDYVQGCWLDWEGLRGWLLESIHDLLPNATLMPCETYAASPRRLASLPLELFPGRVPGLLPEPTTSSIRFSLVVAWVCFGLAALAFAVLLAGAISLSERRGAFVSAVTHELRTPLTTFRMYTDMLAEGMVRKPEKRQRYLETLRREADRLGHLVENVLAYARLERNRAGAKIADLEVDALLGSFRRRLEERAARADMELVVENEAPGAALRGDATAVEQIVFNLVDNACKYAREAEDKRIHLRVRRTGKGVALQVCDHGPGVAKQEAARLFQPFRKSARDAAHSAPGVGLGLALSRRLARAMRGDLRADTRVEQGACFELELPGVLVPGSAA